MLVSIIIFWVFLSILFYTYIGYGLLLFCLVKLKKIFFPDRTPATSDFEPQVTLFVAAYNEKDFIEPKMQNTFSLDYPKEKIRNVWVTDGSDDGTPEFLRKYDDIEVYHLPERSGKIAAMNRGMQFIKTPFVIFSDANSFLSKESIRCIVKLFADPKVGCVSGEKRVFHKDTAAGTESIYWKYESLLKKLDAQLYSVVGAAGELFAVRSALFKPVEPDTLVDDFIVSLRIAQQGFTIQYDPDAYAIENPSASVKEELKRKIRIAAGGIQSIIRLKSLLNPFKYGRLSFQYISHRVLRWTLAPLGIIALFLSNLIIALQQGMFNFLNFYTCFFWIQVILYLISLLGWYMEGKKIKLKLLFIPYYFCIMNYAVYAGFFRYITKRQPVNWERAQRG